MEKFDFFISYKRGHNDSMAMLVFYYLKVKGYKVYLDHQCQNTGSYVKQNYERIENTTFYILLISKDNFLKDITTDSWVYKEFSHALENLTENDYNRFIILKETSVNFSDDEFEDFLKTVSNSDSIKKLEEIQLFDISNNQFESNMDNVINACKKCGCFKEELIWNRIYNAQGTTLVSNREKIENSYATLENRFGKDLVKRLAVINNNYSSEDITDFPENRVKRISLLSLAAAIIFCPEYSMVDPEAYDKSMMYKIFKYLLDDEEFQLNIVINTPNSRPVHDASTYKKVGNLSLDELDHIFYATYFKFVYLINKDNIFKKAFKSGRITFSTTKCVIPYSIFQIEYKDEWKEYNHIKIDLYSPYINSNMERLSMLFFHDHHDEYNTWSFFSNQFKKISSSDDNMKIDRFSIKNKESKVWFEKGKKILEKKGYYDYKFDIYNIEL